MNASDLILSACGQAALDLVARGWHAFPVPPGTKESHKSAKFSDGRKWGATTDPQEVRRDWRRWPEAGLGLVTGPKSGFFVVEADTAEGHDVDGIGNLAALAEEHGGWDDTIEALSPSGSWHIYFRWPKAGGIANSSSRVAPGVDVCGDGGMVVAPPTTRPEHAQPYRWKNPPGLFGFTECPAWLLDLCRKPATGDARSSGFRPNAAGASAWAQAALRAELADVFSAAGSTRNNALDAAAFALGQIVGGGSLGEEDVRARLIGAGLNIGLEEAETRATVNSGLRAGMAEPRTAPEERRRPRGGEDGGEAGREEREPPADTEAFDLSHDALACDLGARTWDANARYVAGWGQWLFWDGPRWARDTSLLHMTRARAYLVRRAEDLTSWAERKAESADEREAAKLTAWAKAEARTLRSATTVAAVTGLARSNAASAASPDDFDADPWLLGTPGGTVDLRTGTLRPVRREDGSPA